jgi:hypothetical protein
MTRNQAIVRAIVITAFGVGLVLILLVAIGSPFPVA